MTSVEVTTGSRLHFGLLCGAPDSGWHYGGIGMMIDAPGWKIQVSLCDHSSDQFDVSDFVRDRLQSLLQSFRSRHGQLPPVSIVARQEARMHSGLGSGTQLTLAAGTALLLLSGRGRPASIANFAATLGRARRSAIGTFGFDHGGFIIDHGKKSDGCQKPIERIVFPDDWRIVLLSPEQSAGLSGDSEEQFFGARSFLTPATVLQFDTLIRAHIIPAVRDASFDDFRRGLSEYGRLVGSFYATTQGGIFSSQRIRELVSSLPGRDTLGMVQSSWGPSVAVPASSQAEAEDLRSRFHSVVDSDEVSIHIVSGQNHGATVRSVAPESQRSLG